MSDVPQSSRVIEMTCYHTCRNSDDRSAVLKAAPFHSNRSTAQWLGQGYYLWTDSDLFAHAWGKNPKYLPTGYAIVKCTLCVPQEQYLDLVGKVDHQQYFLGLVADYRSRLIASIAQAKDPAAKQKGREKLRNMSVSSVIHYFRSARAFPFKVIKALDIKSTQTEELKFLHEGGLGEKLPLPTRQQIVVFPEAKDLLSVPEWHHP